MRDRYAENTLAAIYRSDTENPPVVSAIENIRNLNSLFIAHRKLCRRSIRGKGVFRYEGMKRKRLLKPRDQIFGVSVLG